MNPGVILFFITFLTLALAHNLAVHFFLYWKYAWFDIATHFLGGVTIALGVSVLTMLKISFLPSFRKFFQVALLVLLISVLWEIFEVVGGVNVIDETFVPDTILDLVMGMLGGWVGFILLKRLSF